MWWASIPSSHLERSRNIFSSLAYNYFYSVVTSCNKHWRYSCKHQPDGPLGLSVDLTFPSANCFFFYYTHVFAHSNECDCAVLWHSVLSFFNFLKKYEGFRSVKDTFTCWSVSQVSITSACGTSHAAASFCLLTNKINFSCNLRCRDWRLLSLSASVSRLPGSYLLNSSSCSSSNCCQWRMYTWRWRRWSGLSLKFEQALTLIFTSVTTSVTLWVNCINNRSVHP